jgi:hypothetical protein
MMDIVGSMARRRVSIRSRLFWLPGGMSLITLLTVNLVWLPGTIYHIRENNVELQRIAVRGVRDQIKLFLEQKSQEIKHQAMLFPLAFPGGCARHR